MTEPTYLDLLAEDGRPLRHMYLQQADPPSGLVVLLPGDNYGVDGPLLYYIGQELRRLGWDTLAITYGYQSAGQPFSPLRIADVLSETCRAVERVLSERAYAKLILVGKSLGAALAALLSEQLSMPAGSGLVFLTPPLGPMFNPLFVQTTRPSCIVLGTADRFYDKGLLGELQEAQEFKLICIEDADHSLNVPGDLVRTLDGLSTAVDGVTEFVRSQLGDG